MALQKTYLVVLMLVLMPLVQASRPRFQGATTMAEENTTLATRDFEANLSNSSSNFNSNNIFQDSAREVPTGPDPLHHNENPTGP